MGSSPLTWTPTAAARTEPSADWLVARHSSPSATSSPVASMTSPTTRVVRPYAAKRGTDSIRAAIASTIGQTPPDAFQRTVDAAVHDPVPALHDAASRLDRRIRDPAHVPAGRDRGRLRTARRDRRDRREIARVEQHPERLVDRELHQRASDQIDDRLRTRLELAPDDVPCDGDGERGDVRLERVEPPRPAGPDLGRRGL